MVSNCADGEIAISGGIIGLGLPEIEAELVASGPTYQTTGWFFSWANTGDAPITIHPTVVALCVQGTSVDG